MAREQQREISACEEGRGLLAVAVVQVRMCWGGGHGRGEVSQRRGERAVKKVL